MLGEETRLGEVIRKSTVNGGLRINPCLHDSGGRPGSAREIPLFTNGDFPYKSKCPFTKGSFYLVFRASMSAVC